MDLRHFDPAIGRWVVQDPIVHHDFSPYNAFDNNPVYWADPSGADSQGITLQGSDGNWHTISSHAAVTIYTAPNEDSDNEDEDPQDDITVNSEGVVTNVARNGKPNRFFDENGNELFFNDPDGVDGLYTDIVWSIGDRLFNPISVKQMNDHIIESGLIFERFLAGVYMIGGGKWLQSLSIAVNKGHGDFDFAEKWLVFQTESGGIYSNDKNRRNRDSSYNDAEFFRFGNTNNIYNLYDAGNYMWGRAMGMSGFSYWELVLGSQINELRKGSFDSKVDQRAIKNGFNGN